MFIMSTAALPAPYQAHAAWFEQHIPFFDCPDPVIRELYYFRWDVYRQHLQRTPAGYVVTEFLPNVPWAGPYNTIVCAVGHHLYEGRWLRQPQYLDDYTRFWFQDIGAEPRAYSCWLADAVYARYLVTGDALLPLTLLDNLIANYSGWEAERSDEHGLFWQIDDLDGMEYQISGSGCRPTLNSYLYGDALAIARIATLAGQDHTARQYANKATNMKRAIQAYLWDTSAQFFKTLPTASALAHQERHDAYRRHSLPPQQEAGKLAPVRELQGYIPWYFGLPDPGYEQAWIHLRDQQGFAAPYGPSTAERRNAYWQAGPHDDQHECLWRGSSWPYATSQALVALANLLTLYDQTAMTKQDYFDLFHCYSRTQHLRRIDGAILPWIDESVDPDTGEWVTRAMLYRRQRADRDRGTNYNHSTYADHIITGLVGLRPRSDAVLEINPLLPDDTWDYFLAEDVPYHGHRLTILYDRDGSHYDAGVGLITFVDGRLLGTRENLGPMSLPLTQA